MFSKRPMIVESLSDVHPSMPRTNQSVACGMLGRFFLAAATPYKGRGLRIGAKHAVGAKDGRNL